MTGIEPSLLFWQPLCLEPERIKQWRFTLQDAAAAAQLMSRSLELPENSLLRFPALLQTDLVQCL